MMRFRGVLVVAGVLLWAGVAQGSLVHSFSLQQLFEEADLIVVGEVNGSVSFWNDAHDTIYTEFTVAVEKTVKGTAEGEVTVRLMGGTVDGKTLRVAGNAQMEKGERTLLVLRKSGSFYVVIGMSQGKWSVRKHEGVDCVWRGRTLGNGKRRPGERTLDELWIEMRKPGRGEREHRDE
jgi:hypothetical protein